MKTTKLFFMAALALMTAACSNDDNDLTTPQPQKAEGITITAQLAPKTGGATTRAVSEGGVGIVSYWDEDEHLAVLYEVGGTKKVADAKITAVDDELAATIEFTVEAGTPDNTACTLVYPYSAAKDDKSGVEDAATLLAAQNGTLNANLDVRVGAGTIQTTTPGLTVTTQPAAQFAIFKLTLKNIDATADVSATSVVVSDQNGTVTTVTPASGYDKVMYVALPTTATTLKFAVTDGTTNYFNMASGLSLGTNFYQSTIKLATVGDVILSTGKCAKAGTSGAVAKICYLGSDAETSTTYNHGLALALSDVSSAQTWCSTTSSTCLTTQYSSESDAKGDMAGLANTDALVNHTGHTHAAASAARDYNSGTHPTGTSAWFLPSAGQWDKMATAAGSYANLKTNAGLQSDYYWSSSERNAYSAWRFDFDWGDWGGDNKDNAFLVLVRSCLAF